MEEATKCLFRTSLRSTHSTRMCFTVSGHWQVPHSGKSSPESRKECVKRVWPIRSLFSNTVSRARKLSPSTLIEHYIITHARLIDWLTHVCCEWRRQRDVTFQSLLHKDRTPVGDAMAVDSHLHDIRRASNVKMPHVVEIPAGTGQDQPHFDDHTTQPRSSSLSNLVSCSKVQGGPSPQKSTEQTSPHFPVPGTTFSTHPHSSLPIL